MSLIPDTLTIFISTKIPNYQHFIYNSKNTLTSTDKPILFNPLILFQNNISNSNILFDKKLFDKKLLEDKSEKLPTLIKATKDKYIDKNIKSILDLLFKSGEFIYLGDYPFTIYNMKWNNSWTIQHKPSYSLTNIKDFLLSNNNKTVEENNLLYSLPDEVRTNNTKDLYLQYLTNLYLLKGSINDPITNKELTINDHDLGIYDVLKSIDINQLPINLKFIVNNYRADYLIYISGLYFNLTTDPMILILFYTDKNNYNTPDEYLNIPKYIHENSEIEYVFQLFKEKRILFNSSQYNYWNIWKNLSYQQKKVEDSYKEISNKFKVNPNLSYYEVQNIMNNIESYQKEFYKLFILYFKSFLNVIQSQYSYYKTTLSFLKKLNQHYSDNILSTPLNIENEHIIIQTDIKVFECIVKKFEDPYVPPLNTNDENLNIIKYYKKLYDSYLSIIFNLLKIKSVILFDKIKEDPELIDFYILENYTLNLSIFSYYEYIKTYIFDCDENYKNLFESKSDKRISDDIRNKYLNIFNISTTPTSDTSGSTSTTGSIVDIGLGIKKILPKKTGLPLVPSSVGKSSKLIPLAPPLTSIKIKSSSDIVAYKKKIKHLKTDMITSKKDMDKLLKEIADLKIILARKEKIEEKLTGKVKTSKKELTKVTANLMRLREINKELLARIARLDIETTRNRDNLAAANRELTNLQEQNQELTRRLNASDARERLSAEDRRRLTEQQRIYQAQIVAQQRIITQYERDLLNERRENGALLQQIRDNEGRIQDLLHDNIALGHDNVGLRRDNDAKQERINEMVAAITDMAAELRRLQQELRQSQERYDALQHAMRIQQTQLERQEQEIRQYQLQIEQLNRTIDDKTVNIAQLNARNDSLFVEIQRISRENNELDTENKENKGIKALNAKLLENLKTAQSERVSMLREIDELRKAYSGKRDELEKLQRDMGSINNQLEGRIHSLEQQIEDKNKEIKDKKEINDGERANLLGVIDQLKAEKAETEKSLESEKKIVAEQQTVITSLTGEITSLTDKIQKVFDKTERVTAQFNADLQELKFKNTGLSRQIVLTAKENIKYSDDLKELRASFDEINAQNAKLKASNDRINGILTGMEKTISEITALTEEGIEVRDRQISELQQEIEELKKQLGQKGGEGMLTKITDVVKNIKIHPITKYVDKLLNSLNKSVIDNYTISFVKNFELFDKLITKYNNDEFTNILNELKEKKNLSKLKVKNEQVEFITFIENNTLTYSMLILIVYAIQVVLFKYLNFNTSCMNYFMIQKEYSTFCYLYNQLYYSKLKKNSLFSIPFTINNYSSINLQYINNLKVEYFKEIIFSNSLLCKYYDIYKELNNEINKIFYYINPSLNKQILINFCNYSFFFFITNIIFDVNNTLLDKCEFKNKISEFTNFDFNANDYEKTNLIQYHFLDVIDNGVFLKFLPKQEYVSVNNWYLKEIDTGNELKFWNDNKEHIEDIIHQKLIIFKNMFDKVSFTTNVNINNFIDFIVIYKEIKLFNTFEYLELLNTKEDFLQNRLYNFYIFYYYLYEDKTSSIDFNFDVSNNLINTDTDKDKLFLVISYLYNTIFPTFFNTNADNLLEIFTELIKSITYTETITDIYKIPIIDMIYNHYNSSSYISSNNLKNQEIKLQEIVSNIIKTIRYDNNIFNANDIKSILNNINNLNVYCNEELIKQLLIIMIFLINSIYQDLSKKFKKKNMNISKPDITFTNLNIFYYANMLDTSQYYYYILEKNNNTYKIGDEIIEKSSKKIYIILNKLILQNNVLFQIIESIYVNISNIKHFHNNVKIINSNDINSLYKINPSFPLVIKNNYLQPDIKKKIRFIYYDNKTNTTFYLNNLCLSNNSVDMNYNFFDLDNYLLYFIYYRLILFNKINQLQYNPFVKQYSLNGFSYINLPEYFYFIIQNKSNRLYKQSEYIKKQYQNIMYFHLITDDNYTDVNINLLELYNIFKSSNVDLFEKNKEKIKENLLSRFRRLFKYGLYGGDEERKRKKDKRNKKIEDPEKEDKTNNEDKINKEELLGNSPFSYFIHIELDVLPGKHSDVNTALNLKGITLNCDNKKENIIKSFDEIRKKPYKPKLLSSKYLLTQDPNFPVNKFFPEEEDEEEEKKEKEEEPEEKSGGTVSQIPNLFHKTSFLNDYFTKTN